MNRRALAGLLVTLVILAVLAGIALRGERPEARSQSPLAPDLKSELNKIQRIVVTGAGNRTIATLERGADNWTVAERKNYPADVGRIRKNLLALAEALVVEEKTSNPEFYARLGVEDLASETARGLTLTLTGGREPVSVIIGNAQPGAAEYTYVRRTGEAQSWLVTGRFDPGKTVGDWLDRSLTDIPATRVESVTITHPGLETLRITSPKDGSTEFQVADMPATRKLSYPGVANGIAGVLADLQLTDAATRDALGSAPGKPVVARLLTRDGLTVEASAWRLADGTRVTFVASGTGEAAREADAINARLGGWVYTLPVYRTEQLTRRLQDLLAPP